MNERRPAPSNLEEARRRQALAGVRVVDLGHIVAAGVMTSLLADLGAEVIKVERPEEGDGLRTLGPTKAGQPLWWTANARNKKSVTLDLKAEAGKRLCRELVQRSDLVVENFRPGTLEKLGLGWEALSGLNPRLVMVRISGYGQTGPYSHRTGFGRAGEAMSGAVQLTGFPDGPPIHPGFSLADATTGLMGAYAAMVALYHRDALGGTGQFIDLALYETLFRLIDWQVIFYDQLGVLPERAGSRFPFNLSSVANLYPTRDGHWIAISAATYVIAQRVLRLVGGEELARDPRFQSDESRRQNADALDALIADWMRRHDRDDIVRRFEAAEAVACPVYTVRDMVADAHFEHRANIIEVDDPVLGPVKMHGPVPRFSATPGAIVRTGPRLGQDNRDVFVNLLGLSEVEYAEMTAKGVI